ncbi:hypothetical protein [Streptomyces sp. NPDC086777]|uniref:hypothetical protein n=1 Tax=Streptomyces sp. NPDC086777 TaxID=3154866 RepID=UPI003450721A
MAYGDHRRPVGQPQVIFPDRTAVLALCRGRRLLSGPAVVEVGGPARRAHVPASCPVAAGLERPGVAAHVGAPPGLEILPLDFAGAAMVEQVASAGLDWPFGHAVYAASADPTEGQVLTAVPEAYDGTGVLGG